MVASPQLNLVSVGKKFGAVAAVSDVSFSVGEGEVVALLGPSGCGKTTLLRCISGLEPPTSGDIEIGGATVFSAATGINQPPERRQIGLVFQSYALWPHFTVGQNVAYGLKVKRVPANEIRDRVAKILATVGLAGMGDRYPSTLSGGQQQRVALARSLVTEARVILFDEPLSNLDLKLREEMRHELRQLVNRLGFTAVFVTHDQSEALVLADRIALMSRGKLIQLGTARDIYNRPKTKFALEFLGTANTLPGAILNNGADIALKTASGFTLELGEDSGTGTLAAIRPERIGLNDRPETDANTVSGTILDAVFLGNLTLYQVDCGWVKLQVQSVDHNHEIGEKVVLHLPADAIHRVEE